jgi:hypothetical protein
VGFSVVENQSFESGLRRCIFCGGTGMSKEHIWARWMVPHLPKDPPNFSLLDVVVHKTHETRKERTDDRSAYSGTINLVCKLCNNGWMSVLQERTKPILLPLISGEKPALSRNDRRVLAAWITMFVMVAEFQVRDKVSITPEVRADFSKTGIVPTNWAIWLGFYERDRWRGLTVHSTIPVSSLEDGIDPARPDGLPMPNTHATTIVIGKLYVHALGSVFSEFAKKNRLDQAKLPMSRLWPLGFRPFKWPSTTLNDEQASKISRALIDHYRLRIPFAG